MCDEESLSECFSFVVAYGAIHHRSDAVLVRGLASAGMLCSSESPFEPELLPLLHKCRVQIVEQQDAGLCTAAAVYTLTAQALRREVA